MPTGPAPSGRPDDKLRMVEGASALEMTLAFVAPSTMMRPHRPARFNTETTSERRSLKPSFT
jgi:hypothetical protein